MPSSTASGVDPLWLAQSRFRRRRFEDCVALCTEALQRNPYDEAFWYLKCRALTEIDWLDDTDMDDESLAEALLDDNAIAQMPRPGTSMQRPTATGGGALMSRGGGARPLSSSGRPSSGFIRPNTAALKPGASLERALTANRGSTARPVTSSGRFVRLGTASMLAQCGDAFVDVHRIDTKKYASRPFLAKVLCDYLLHVEHNPKKALELCSHATKQTQFADWWWKERLGKCYYQLGMLRESERQLVSSLKHNKSAVTTLQLCKVYVKMDQPLKALEAFQAGLDAHKNEVALMLGAARCHESVSNFEEGLRLYKQALHYDPSNVEALACLANDHFYNDQPEIALRYYRRLLQMGVSNAEVWNNLALCCFYSSQYDVTIHCFEQALSYADEGEEAADIWYNIGQVAVSIGDIGLAYQAFKISVSMDSNHAESYNNLGVLELKKGSFEQARSNFQLAERLGPHLFEPTYNSALICHDVGDLEESRNLVAKVLDMHPEHQHARDLLSQLDRAFTFL